MSLPPAKNQPGGARPIRTDTPPTWKCRKRTPYYYAERISDTNLPFSGGWKLDLERRELTTQVTVHSRSELHWPLDRLFVRLFVKPEREVDKILDGLKRRVEGSTVKPTAATS